MSIANGVTYGEAKDIALDVTGVDAADYALTPATLSLAAGETSAEATFEALADEADEPRESARIVASVDGAEVGAATVAIRPVGTDATLSDLTLTDVAMPAFDADTPAYAATAAPGAASTTVEATPADANAAVEITDAAGSTVGTRRTSTLATGANEISATVTAEDGGTERTYTVTVTRPPGWGERLPARDIELAGTRQPMGLWSDGSVLWVTPSWYSASLLAYDLATGERLTGRDIELSEEQVYSALTGAGGTLWAALYGQSHVEAYRLSDGERLADDDLADTLAAAENGNPTGLWAHAGILRVADWSDRRIYAYALADGARDEDAEFGLTAEDTQTIRPWGLFSAGDTALVSSWGRGAVRAYRVSDGARLEARDIATDEANADPHGLWSNGKVLWVVDATDAKLYAYAVPGLAQAESPSGGLPVRVASRAAPVPSADPGPAVPIPDAGLRGRIAAALGKSPDETVGVNELAALTALDARDAGVRNLAGLEHAVNLAALDLGGNAIADLRVLASLPRLETLNLDATGVDPWALAGLAGLRALSLRDNALDDLAALSGLARLERLDIGNNRFDDLMPLTALPRLKALRADGNPAADADPFDRPGRSRGP